MSGNCYDCVHLEWIDGDIGDPSGWVCNKREYKTDKEEDKHLKQLESEAYLSRIKKCREITE